MTRRSTIVTSGPESRGFTLIELIVTVAIAAVMLGYGLPAFNGFLVQQRMDSQIENMVIALAYARSEAMNRRVNVSVVSVDSAAGADEWGPGWCVTTGADCVGDDVIRQFSALDGQATLDGLSDLDAVGAIAFDARGVLVNAGATFTLRLCSTDANQTMGRAIDISLVGRTSTERFDCGGGS